MSRCAFGKGGVSPDLPLPAGRRVAGTAGLVRGGGWQRGKEAAAAWAKRADQDTRADMVAARKVDGIDRFLLEMLRLFIVIFPDGDASAEFKLVLCLRSTYWHECCKMVRRCHFGSRRDTGWMKRCLWFFLTLILYAERRIAAAHLGHRKWNAKTLYVQTKRENVKYNIIAGKRKWSRCSIETRERCFRQCQSSCLSDASGKKLVEEFAIEKMDVQASHLLGSNARCVLPKDCHQKKSSSKAT